MSSSSQVHPMQQPSAPPSEQHDNKGYPPSGGAPPPYPTNDYQGYPPQPQPTRIEVQGAGVRTEIDVEEQGEENHFEAGKSFGDKAIRHAFIKKVYLILTVQMLITVGIICLFLFVDPVRNWVQWNSWAYWLSYGIFLATYIVLVCIPAVRRNSPGNYICLLVFTLALSYMTATISSFYDTSIVLICMGITCGLCLLITLFAIQTKIDFTMCTGLLFALVSVLILFGFACLITWAIEGDNFTTYVMNVVYGALAALVFSLFLVFDTQRVVGGKNRKYQLSPEEYITGALQIYLDIVYLFIIILGLAGSK